jgi:hypothetical protein
MYRSHRFHNSHQIHTGFSTRRLVFSVPSGFRHFLCSLWRVPSLVVPLKFNVPSAFRDSSQQSLALGRVSSTSAEPTQSPVQFSSVQKARLSSTTQFSSVQFSSVQLCFSSLFGQIQPLDVAFQSWLPNRGYGMSRQCRPWCSSTDGLDHTVHKRS